MARLDPGESHETLKERVKAAIGDSFPYEGDKNVLSLKDVEISDNLDIKDVRSQKAAKLGGRTWGIPVHATMELADKKTGEIVDSKKIKVATLPKITKRYSYIMDGSEYQVDNLWLLKPGVYTRVKQNGELETQFNTKGGGFHVKFDPEKRKFNMRHGGANPPLYPIMKALGTDDDTLERQWGKEILAANRTKDYQKQAITFAQRLRPKETIDSFDKASEIIRSDFQDSKIDPEVTKRTLGKEFSSIDKDAVISATNRLLGVSRGEEKPDDRDSLMFKELKSTEDFIADRVTSNDKMIRRKVGNNIDRKTKIRDIVGPDLFNRPIRGFFAKSSLASTPEQTNPLAMVSAHQKTTIMGDEGGVKSAHRIIEDAKLVNPSHLGFLDPIHTPESEKTGVTLHMTLGASKRGDKVTMPLYNTKTNKVERVTTDVAFDSKVAMPDGVSWKDGLPSAKGEISISAKGNDVVKGSLKDADYVMTTPAQVFSIATNMVPFLANNSQNRATMAGRHQEQAIALKHREAPLVQAVGGGGVSFDSLVGKFTAQDSPVDGKVVDVKPDGIFIEDGKGKVHDVPIYDNYPLNEKKGMIDSEPTVKVGDQIKKGQLISDTSFTKGGVYAPGVNLNVAYIPARGYNVEDGIVISETGAKRLTSEHMYKKSLSTQEGQLKGLSKYQAYYPDRINKVQAKKLDSAGVAKVGQIVEPGDTLVAALSETQLTKEDQQLQAIHKSLVRPYRDKAVVWEEDHPGKVVEVVKKGKGVIVHVKTEEPASVGDKIVSRHANKGIIGSVLPDKEMPKNAKGEAFDVLLNPLGVAGRMNTGQILETSASKIAEKTGNVIKVRNFNLGDATSMVEQDLKKHNLSDTETITDPKTGRAIPNVLTGKQYMLKLQHQVDKKMSVRSRDSYDRNLVPKAGLPHGGQSLGQLEMYAMIGHAAKKNIREMATYKASGDNDDVWTALQAGELLPPPKPTFAYQKFTSYMKGMGINIEKDGNSLIMSPMTDKHVKAMSSGEIKDGGKMVKMKNLQEEKGGLFDPQVTGGHGGDKWGHINLKEPMPNPIFEKAIMSVSGMRRPQFEAILDGKNGVTKDGTIVGPEVDGAQYGPSAVGRLLDKVDINKQLKSEEARIGKLRGQQLNEANRRVKYLRALKKSKLKPTEAYMMGKVPVLPPVMRPMSVMGDGSIQFEDINQIYKQVALTNQKIGSMSKLAPDEEKAPLRSELYDELKGLAGTGGMLNKRYSGFLDVIAGGTPKTGFFQEKLVKRRQDMSMRSTIVPEPSLGIDEVGVPRKAAMELFKPFVVRELKSIANMTPLQAQEAIKENREIANKALEKVTGDRPLLLKRDPVLHKYGIQAFNAKLTEGKAIKIHPLVTSGFNADFDGDQQIGSVFVWIDQARYDMDQEFWEPRIVEMTARFKTKLPVINRRGKLAICNLADFPHLPQKSTKDHIDYHPVPYGIKVIALDEKEGPVLAEVTGWSHHKQRKVEIVRLSGSKQIITDDDERAIYGVDGDTLEWCRKRPSEAHNMYVPILEEIPDSIVKREKVRLPIDTEGKLKKEAVLDEQFGYFLGVLVVAPYLFEWDDQPMGIFVPKMDSKVLDRLAGCLTSVFQDKPESVLVSQVVRRSRLQDRFHNTGKRPIYHNESLAEYLKGTIGTGTDKHLPPFVYAAPEEFVSGLLSGFWDAGVFMDSGTKNFKLELTSLRLLQEMQQVLLTRCVSSYIVFGTNGMWSLYISTVDIQDGNGVGIDLSNARKVEFLERVLSGKNRINTKRFVPLPKDLLLAIGSVLVDHRPIKEIIGSMKRGTPIGRITKGVAIRALNEIDRIGVEVDHPLFEKWRSLVRLNGVYFGYVREVEVTDQPEDGYDLTVPGYETFMSCEGTVLSNTMSAFIPITEGAKEEARSMHPSNMIFSPATHKSMYTPFHEMNVGISDLMRVGKDSKKSYTDMKELKSQIAKGEINGGDLIRFNGKKTTFNRLKVYNSLPQQVRDDKMLTDPKFKLTKKDQNKLFGQIAKSDPKNYLKTMDQLKDLGNEQAYMSGFSIGLKDIKADSKLRDKIIGEADRKAKGLDPRNKKDAPKYLRIYEDALTKLDGALKKKAMERDETSLDRLENSAGIKGSGYRQITGAPVLFTDARGNAILNPVKRSYSEGLSVSDYWTSVSGGRKGILQKTQATAEPGYLTKQMMNSTMNILIHGNDCGTEQGIALSTDEPDIVGRYTQAPVQLGRSRTLPAGTLLDPNLVSDMKNKKVSKVVVRSPLKCNHAKGICPKCAGLNERGQLHEEGTNIGVLASQALGERGTQLSMRAFHCVHAESLVCICERNHQRPVMVTMEELFDYAEGDIVYDVDSDEYIKNCYTDQGILILCDQGWTSLRAVRKHKPTSPMVAVTSKNNMTICQDNHPVAISSELPSLRTITVFCDGSITESDGTESLYEFKAPKDLKLGTDGLVTIRGRYHKGGAKAAVGFSCADSSEYNIEVFQGMFGDNTEMEFDNFFMAQRAVLTANFVDQWARLDLSLEGDKYVVSLVDMEDTCEGGPIGGCSYKHNIEKVDRVRVIPYDRKYVYDVTTNSGTFYASNILHHNSGGVHAPGAEGLADVGMTRAKELLNLPKKLKGSAVLSSQSGKVTGIKKDPAGGHNVTISGQRHYVPTNRRLTARVGLAVKKGDPITSGSINPHELLPLAGLNKTQNYLADELHKVYSPEGIRRRNSEVVVKAMSNVTKITDPGDHPDYLRGDYGASSQVQNLNRTVLRGKNTIKHQPVFRGVNQIPLDVQEDWLARLNHEELKSTVVEGAQRGWQSKLHGAHPIPPLVYGAEFGKGDEDEPYGY